MGIFDKLFKKDKGEEQQVPEAAESSPEIAQETGAAPVSIETTAIDKASEDDVTVRPITERCPICGMYQLVNEGIRPKMDEPPNPMHDCMGLGCIPTEAEARKIYYEYLNA